MTQPEIPATTRDALRDLVVRGVRNLEIHRRSALPILEALGLHPDDARDLVHAAEEAAG